MEIILAVISLIIAIGSFATYLSTIPRGKVPVWPTGTFITLTISNIVALTAIFLNYKSGGVVGIIGIVVSIFALFMGGAFFWLFSQRKTPIGNLKVKVGDKLLGFSATTSEGSAFNSDSLKGKRTLLKFFRGGWCPYCSAELVLFDSMRPRLEEYNVEILALSKDTPEEAAIHSKRDNLHFPLLSDPKLDVIKQYGVEHHQALGQTTGSFTMFGIPIGTDFSFKAMAIPTSLLVDKEGTIRWIDQSEDYRLRASEISVMQAVKEAFVLEQ